MPIYLGVSFRVSLINNYYYYFYFYKNDFKFMGITTITPLKEISSSKFADQNTNR